MTVNRKTLLLALVSAALFVQPLHAQYTINMREADVRAFVQDAARVTGKTFIVDSRVQTKVSIVTENEVELIKFTGDNGKPGYIAVVDGKPIIAGTDKKMIAAIAAGDVKAKPVLSKELSARQEGLSDAIKACSWKAQTRLHKRTMQLRARGKHRNKVTVAIARELTGFIWHIFQLMAPLMTQPAIAA